MDELDIAIGDVERLTKEQTEQFETMHKQTTEIQLHAERKCRKIIKPDLDFILVQAFGPSYSSQSGVTEAMTQVLNFPFFGFSSALQALTRSCQKLTSSLKSRSGLIIFLHLRSA